MEIKVEILCKHCHSSFELKAIEHNGCLKASVANFESCPHCDTRNDHWLKIDWPENNDRIKELEFELNQTKIALDFKTRHLEQCEKALEERDAEGVELTEISLPAADERFSKDFMDAVEEFYEEWKVENDAKLPDFEEALKRAKAEGVAPQH